LQFPHRGVGDDTVDSIVVKTRDEYFKLFSKLDQYKVIGEASSDYLYFHEYTVDAIKKELGDIPIIFSIRNPIERAYSAYSNLIRDGRETLDFMDALQAEDSRIEDNWDWMWAYKKGGLYADAIEHFQKEFSNVKVVLFDDLESNPNNVLYEIFDFLNVEKDIVINSDTRYSHSGKPKNKFVAMLTDRNNKVAFKMRQMVLSILPRSILESIASKMLKKDDISMEAKEYLNTYFSNDILKLEKILNRNLNSWRI
jgi:predicted AlkP superfamily pyrophosphatase or phosphodiesterase